MDTKLCHAAIPLPEAEIAANEVAIRTILQQLNNTRYRPFAQTLLGKIFTRMQRGKA